jgi:hypothetical protein
MPGDIPAQIEFEHLLSHTFPGFFSAITLFMLIDVWSPYNITSLIIEDINSLIAFFGFVLVIGTILGIIIDYIHHWLIESLIFDKFDEIQYWIMRFNRLADRSVKSYNQLAHCDDENIFFYYYVTDIGSEAINYIQHLRKAKYCYSEFYSNIFISLIPFSLVVPFYMLKNFQISWQLCVYISLAFLILACISLLSSYQAYLNYNKSLYYLMRGWMKSRVGAQL